MLVTCKPPNREEFALTLDGLPQFSSSRDAFGYEAATIPCQLSDEERLNVLGARIRLHGVTGIAWQGICTRRPGRDEPLVAQGWGWCGTLHRREAYYCDTDMSPWRETHAVRAGTNGVGRNLDIEVDIREEDIYFLWAAGRTFPIGAYNAIFRNIPQTNKCVLTFDWTRPNQNDRYLIVDSGVADTGTTVGDRTTFTTQWTQPTGSGGTSGTATITMTGTLIDAIRIRAGTAAQTTPANTDGILVSNIKLYNVPDVTTINTANVITDILTNEIDSDYLAAVGDYIDAEATVVEPLIFDSCDANTKLAELGKYAAYDFYWKMERDLCLPHWTAESATPDYIIREEEAEASDLDESSLDELVSVSRVTHPNSRGLTRYTDVTDTDTTHPLVALGITRYGDVGSQATATAASAAIGTLDVAHRGRAQLKGGVTTRTIYTATGAPAYLPDIRCGQMAYVTLPDGPRECIITRVECVGDAIATVELDNAGYRLDLALASLMQR